MPKASWLNAAVDDMKEIERREMAEFAVRFWGRSSITNPSPMTTATITPTDDWAVFLPASKQTQPSAVVPVCVTIAYLVWWVAVAWWRFA